MLTQFPSQIKFWEQFLFFAYFELPNKFFSLKNRKLFLKTENKGKKQLQNIPLGIWDNYIQNNYFKNHDYHFGMNFTMKITLKFVQIQF